MSDEDSKAEHQQEAEAEVERFRDQLGPFVVAAETTRMPMVFTNAKEPDDPIIFANDSFLELTGYARDEVLGRSLSFLIPHDADEDTTARVEARFKGEDEEYAEVECRRKDGSTLWAGLFISAVRDSGGEIVQHFASFIDLSRHRAAEAESRLLVDELNHRVKNTLTTVQSIVSQGLRNAPEADDARKAIDARLVALSRSHDVLTRQHWTDAGLRDVVVEALQPFGISNGKSGRVAIEGENVRFPPKAVLALSIALHELATNAVKYGALSNDSGRIAIDWAVQPATGGDRLTFHWRESDGPPVAPPTRRGFGSRVIESGLAHELNGEVSLDYRPEGLVGTIDIPVP